MGISDVGESVDSREDAGDDAVLGLKVFVFQLTSARSLKPYRRPPKDVFGC
jgi:hypothetical protein